MNSRLSAVFFGSAAAGVALLALLDVAAKGFVLLAVACVVALAMRRAPASARHLVWLAALACALVLPLGSWALPGWRVLPTWMKWETVQAAVVHLGIGTERMDRTERTDVPSWKMPATPEIAQVRPVFPSVHSVPAPVPRAFRISAAALLGAWAAGATLLLGPLAWSVFALARVSRRARVVGDGRIASHVAAIADELGLLRRIRILLGDAEAMPMVWGIFRAHLLLPSSAADWPEARLRGVLLHELAHLRRRDPLALLVAQLALALHWFNPLAWFAVRRLRAEQERACDDFVLRHGIRPSEYATDLLAVATGLRAQPFAAAALTMAHPARIEGRIAGILDAARNRATLTRRIICAAAFLAAAIALPLAMLRAAEEKKPAIASGKPHIVSASIAEQELRLEVSAGQVPLTFRVGGDPGARRFAHRVGENAPRKLSVAFSPDAGPLWERLEILYAGHAPHRLPPLRKDFLPDGEWKWRATANREGERFTFADVLLADGRKLPVSVEVGEVADVEEVPFMRVTGLVECEFRFYGVADDSLKEPAKRKLTDAEKLVMETPATLENLLMGNTVVGTPRVTTRSGQRATIEIIREYRHEVKPGEFFTDNLGTTCEIEPELLDLGVMVRGKVSLALYEGKYASLDEAIAKAMSKEATAPVTAKVRRLEKEFSTALAEDEALVVPLPSEGMFPGAALAVVTMKRIDPAEARSIWQPKSERTKNRIPLESWLVTVPASARAETGSVLPILKVGASTSDMMLDDAKFQALKSYAVKNTAVKIEQLETVIAQPEEAVMIERGDVRVEFKADQRLGNPQVELEVIAPMATPTGLRKVSTSLVVLPGSRVSFPYLPTDDGRPQRVLLIRPKPLTGIPALTVPTREQPKEGAATKLPDDALWDTKVPFEKIPVNIANWSAEKNGMRIGMRVVADDGWRLGGKVMVELWLHNPSAKDVSFIANPARWDVGLAVAAKDSEGNDHWAGNSNIDIIAIPQACVLPAGYVAKVKAFELSFVAPDSEAKFWYQPHVPSLAPGKYKLRCQWMDAQPSDSRPDFWSGDLTTNELDFALAGAETAGPVDPPKADEAADGRKLGAPERTHLFNDKYSAVAVQSERDVNFVLIYSGFISTGMQDWGSGSGAEQKWGFDGDVYLVDTEKTRVAGRNVNKRKIAVKYTSDAPTTLFLDGKAYDLSRRVRATSMGALEVPGRIFILRDEGGPIQTDRTLPLRNAKDLATIGDFAEHDLFTMQTYANSRRVQAMEGWVLAWDVQNPVSDGDGQRAARLRIFPDGRVLSLPDGRELRELKLPPAEIAELLRWLSEERLVGEWKPEMVNADGVEFERDPVRNMWDRATDILFFMRDGKRYGLAVESPGSTSAMFAPIRERLWELLKNAVADEEWSVEGTVTNAEGKPLAGVPIHAHTEYKPDEDLATTKTDAAGKYRVAFRLDSDMLQKFRGVTLAPVHEGFIDRELARSGEFNALLHAAEKPRRPGNENEPYIGPETFAPGAMRRFAERDLVRNAPGHADFVLVPAGEIFGEIVDDKGSPLSGCGIAVSVPDQQRYASLARFGCVAMTGADEKGRFRLKGLPLHMPLIFAMSPAGKIPENGQTAPEKFAPGGPHHIRIVLPHRGSDWGAPKIEHGEGFE